MVDDEQPAPAMTTVPDTAVMPPIPAQTAVARAPQHRVPSGPRAPFLPADHVAAKHHLKPGR